MYMYYVYIYICVCVCACVCACLRVCVCAYLCVIHILVARMNISINPIPIALAGGRRRRSMYWLGTAGYTPAVPPGYRRMQLLRHGRGAARAVLSCAGEYVSGDYDSNACPAGSARIETEAACRTAVVAAGKTFAAVVTDSGNPRGCYYVTGGTNADFNTHAVGTGWFSAQPLCAALATTGARVPNH